MRIVRHVPGQDVSMMEILGFEEALTASQLPRTDYDTQHWLFVPPEYTEYRYLLGTRGNNPLICIGINPSTARPDALDPTLQSVERIALNNGFDSFIMMNVYPQRATSPDDMGKECSARLREENAKAFAYALSLTEKPTVWAAWGNLIEKRPYLKPCLKDLIGVGNNAGASWVRCGAVSKAGHPHHPLYLRKDEPLVSFDAGTYAGKI